MAIGVNLTGIESLQNALKKLDEKLVKEVSNEINASSLKIQSDAKRLAPVNMGYLRNSIVLDGQIGSLTYNVEARMPYAPYVEFGTGGKVSIPTGYEDYASIFKGKGDGKFKDFILELTKWVERKGIGSGKKSKSIAYAIALNILRKGLRPQPFLIPSFETEKPKLIKRLNDLLNA